MFVGTVFMCEDEDEVDNVDVDDVDVEKGEVDVCCCDDNERCFDLLKFKTSKTADIFFLLHLFIYNNR